MTKKLPKGHEFLPERKAMENTYHNLTEAILAAPKSSRNVTGVLRSVIL